MPLIPVVESGLCWTPDEFALLEQWVVLSAPAPDYVGLLCDQLATAGKIQYSFNTHSRTGKGLIKKELNENSRITIENLVDLDPSDSEYLKAFLY